MEDQGREADALSRMPSEINIEVSKDSVPICAKNVELDCKCFSNISFHNGWAQRRPNSADSGGTKGRVGLLHVDRMR